MDVIKLPEYFAQVTVNKKRDKKKSSTFSDSQMCMGLCSLPILGISRINRINERLSNETELAKLLGLPRFFDQSTAHKYLNSFGKWHVSQLDRINHQLQKTAVYGLKNILPKEWHHDTIETLRDKLIHHGASVRFVDGICNLRLNASFRYKTELVEVLNNLRHEVQTQEDSRNRFS